MWEGQVQWLLCLSQLYVLWELPNSIVFPMGDLQEVCIPLYHLNNERMGWPAPTIKSVLFRGITSTLSTLNRYALRLGDGYWALKSRGQECQVHPYNLTAALTERIPHTPTATAMVIVLPWLQLLPFELLEADILAPSLNSGQNWYPSHPPPVTLVVLLTFLKKHIWPAGWKRLNITALKSSRVDLNQHSFVWRLQLWSFLNFIYLFFLFSVMSGVSKTEKLLLMYPQVCMQYFFLVFMHVIGRPNVNVYI